MRRRLHPNLLLLLVWFLEDAVSAIEPTESTFDHVGFSSVLNERPNIRETLILFPLSPERKTGEEDNLKEKRVPSAPVEEGPRPLKRLMNVQHPSEFRVNAIQQHQPEIYSGTTLPTWMPSSSLPSAPVEEADSRPLKRPLNTNALNKNIGYPEEFPVTRQPQSSISHSGSTLPTWMTSTPSNERPDIRETLILLPLSPKRKTGEEDSLKEEIVPSAPVEEGPRPLTRLMNVNTRENGNQHPAEFRTNAIQQHQPEIYPGATLPARIPSPSLPSAPVEEADSRPLKRPLNTNALDKNNGYPKEFPVIRQPQSSISHSGSTLPTWMSSTPSKKTDLPQHQQPESSLVLQNNSPASHPLPSIPETSHQQSKVNKLSLKRKTTTPKDFPLLNGASGSAADNSLPPHPFQHGTIEDQKWSELRDSMQLSTDHSCQILNWTPRAINPKAALVSHFMANEFQKAIASFPVKITLQSMHGSHQILIPFVYGLMIKPLTAESWARIVLVWRNFWYDKSGKLLDPPAEVLRKFLWISDLISESVMPELFENALGRVEGARLPNSLHLLTHEARIIKLLSDGRRQLDYITADQQQALLHMKTKSAEENIPEIQEANLLQNQILSSARVMTILNRLKQKAQLINPPHSEMENIRERIQKQYASFWDENLWVHHINPRNPLAIFNAMGSLPHLTGCPVEFKPKLVEFFQILEFEPISLANSPGTNLWEMDDLLRMIDRRIKDINAGKLHRPNGFLPEVINTVFREEYKSLLTKKQVKPLNPIKLQHQV